MKFDHSFFAAISEAGHYSVKSMSLLATLLVACASHVALAKDPARIIHSAIMRSGSVSFEINRGESAAVFIQATFDPQMCTFIGLPTVGVISPPQNGHVSADTALFLRVRNGRCFGKRLQGIRVVYTPREGFSGVDQIILSNRSPIYRIGRGYPTGTITMTVNVH
jgi:hypothetical protein